MTGDRTPYDGQPYYCALCGAGLAEFYACELPECDLETQAQARARQQQKLAEARAH
jgi:hypothetical protein